MVHWACSIFTPFHLGLLLTGSLCWGSTKYQLVIIEARKCALSPRRTTRNPEGTQPTKKQPTLGFRAEISLFMIMSWYELVYDFSSLGDC